MQIVKNTTILFDPDLHPLDNAHAERTTKKSRLRFEVCFLSSG